MGKYQWVGQVRIKKKRKTKLCTSKKEAVKWEEDQKSQTCQQEIHTTSLIEWASAYLAYAEREFVGKTFSEKRLAFKHLFTCKDISPSMPAESLSPLTVLNHLQDQTVKRSGGGANKDRKNLGAAWEWGVAYLHLPRLNPIKAVSRFAQNKKERAVPTVEDFKKAVDACDTDQDRLMLWAYLQTGARREELFRLGWRDVDLVGKRVRLRWRKNQKGGWEEQWIPVKGWLVDWLKRHQKVTGLHKFVFLNFNNSEDPRNWLPYLHRQHWLDNVCKRAKIKPFGFHGLRHLFASLLAAENTPLVDIQHMLRHKSINTTARYIHQLKKENREVLRALPDILSPNLEIHSRAQTC